jgi:hypothetical protein
LLLGMFVCHWKSQESIVSSKHVHSNRYTHCLYFIMTMLDTNSV